MGEVKIKKEVVFIVGFLFVYYIILLKGFNVLHVYIEWQDKFSGSLHVMQLLFLIINPVISLITGLIAVRFIQDMVEDSSSISPFVKIIFFMGGYLVSYVSLAALCVPLVNSNPAFKHFITIFDFQTQILAIFIAPVFGLLGGLTSLLFYFGEEEQDIYF